MLFTTKIFLYGLLGLLLPLFIHLWNKQKPEVIAVGSIELMEELESQKSYRFQISDWLLLLLRLLVIGVLVFLLMKPYFLKDKTIEAPVHYKHILLVDPLLEKEEAIQKTIEELGLPAFLFCEEFPLIDRLTTTERQSFRQKNDYWTLLSSIDFADTVTVFGINKASNFKGKRIEPAFFLNWKNIEIEEKEEQVIKASKLEETTYLLSILESTVEGNQIKKLKTSIKDGLIEVVDRGKIIYKKQDTLLLSPLDTLRIGFKHDSKTKEAWKLIESALKTIESHSEIPILFNTEKLDCFFCLGDIKDCPIAEINLFYEKQKRSSNNVKIPQIIDIDKQKNFKLLGDINRANPQIKSLPVLLNDFINEVILKNNLQENTIDLRKISMEYVDRNTPLNKAKLTEAKIIQEKNRKHFPIWLLLMALVLLERLMVIFRR